MMKITPHAFGVDDNACPYSHANTPSAWMMIGTPSSVLLLGWAILSEHYWETSHERRSLDLAAHKKPDIVLMDIHLAGQMRGVDAARRIWERFQIPVVYVTAYADSETLKEVAATENYGYIVKPFHTQAVHAAIQIALGRREKEVRQP